MSQSSFVVRLPAVLVLAAVPWAVPSAQGTWTVDDDGPADFADLPAAVAGAAEGDVLLVSAGSYSSFTIQGKSLSVVGEPGGGVLLQEPGAHVRVLDLAAHQAVLLRDLVVSGKNFGTGPTYLTAFLAEDCAGPILVEDCVLEGAEDTPSYPHGWAGAWALGSASVTFVRCTLAGRLADERSYGLNHGLYSLSSSVFVHESTLTGGDTTGGPACQSGIPYCYEAGWAGDGLRAEVSVVQVSGSTLRGGTGRDGAWADPFQDLCGDGASGGSGLALLYGSNGLVIDSLLEPGTGGAAGVALPGYEPCTAGSAGGTLVAVGSTVGTPAGVRRALAAPSVARETELLSVELLGAPGELAVVGFSAPAAALPVPRLAGALSIALPPLATLVAGPLDGSGAGTLSVPVGELPPGVAGLVLHLQAVHVGGPDGLRLGAPGSTVVLDAAR